MAIEYPKLADISNGSLFVDKKDDVLIKINNDYCMAFAHVTKGAYSGVVMLHNEINNNIPRRVLSGDDLKAVYSTLFSDLFKGE